MLAGTSLGMIFLLFGRKVHSVSIGIVLLMQTVWMGSTRNDFRKSFLLLKIGIGDYTWNRFNI
jgi:hypothetical protein